MGERLDDKGANVKEMQSSAGGWDGYWSSVGERPQEVFWDAEAERVGALDLDRFEGLVDRRRTLLDFGCGNGTQTRFFAGRFDKVIGVDVSEAAIELARRATASRNGSYRVLDGLRPEQAQALHDEIGDVNVYVRGVFHQMSAEDRPACASSIEAVLGMEGTLFVAELSASAEDCLASFVARHGGLPPGLQRAFEFGLVAGALRSEELDALFPRARYDVLALGESIIHTTHGLPEGGFMEIPALYRVLRRRRG